MGSRWWNRHLNDRSGPPLVDVMYHSEVEYNSDTFIDLPSLTLAWKPERGCNCSKGLVDIPIHAHIHVHRYQRCVIAP